MNASSLKKITSLALRCFPACITQPKVEIRPPWEKVAFFMTDDVSLLASFHQIGNYSILEQNFPALGPTAFLALSYFETALLFLAFDSCHLLWQIDFASFCTVAIFHPRKVGLPNVPPDLTVQSHMSLFFILIKFYIQILQELEINLVHASIVWNNKNSLGII